MLTLTSLRAVHELVLLLNLCVTSGLCTTDSELWFDGTINNKSEDANDSSLCPPWKYQKTPNSTCECGSSIGQVVHCSNKITMSL